MADTLHCLELSYQRTEGTEDAESGDFDANEQQTVTLKLQGEDLESLSFVMRKVEKFLRQVGFDYLSIRQASEDHLGDWAYEVLPQSQVAH